MSAPSGPPRPSSSRQTGTRAGRPFPKSSRILKSTEFRQVYDEGTRFSTRLFAAFCRDTGNPARPTGARVGFTVPRGIGKAVVRNRIRRRLREALRQDLPLIGPQWDIVVNPRRAVLDAPFAELSSEVRKLVNRCKP